MAVTMAGVCLFAECVCLCVVSSIRTGMVGIAHCWPSSCSAAVRHQYRKPVSIRYCFSCVLRVRGASLHVDIHPVMLRHLGLV